MARVAKSFCIWFNLKFDSETRRSGFCNCAAGICLKRFYKEVFDKLQDIWNYRYSALVPTEVLTIDIHRSNIWEFFCCPYVRPRLHRRLRSNPVIDQEWGLEGTAFIEFIEGKGYSIRTTKHVASLSRRADVPDLGTGLTMVNARAVFHLLSDYNHNAQRTYVTPND